jgi:hypothetical protein
MAGVFEGFSKAPHFNANSGDACGCHYSLGGAVVDTFFVLGLQVKTLDRRSGRSCVLHRGALSPRSRSGVTLISFFF